MQLDTERPWQQCRCLSHQELYKIREQARIDFVQEFTSLLANLFGGKKNA